MISRRTFLHAVAGGVLAPLAAEAQPAGKVYRIGLLGARRPQTRWKLACGRSAPEREAGL